MHTCDTGDRQRDRYEQDEAADLGAVAEADSHPQESSREGKSNHTAPSNTFHVFFSQGDHAFPAKSHRNRSGTVRREKYLTAPSQNQSTIQE